MSERRIDEYLFSLFSLSLFLPPSPIVCHLSRWGHDDGWWQWVPESRRPQGAGGWLSARTLLRRLQLHEPQPGQVGVQPENTDVRRQTHTHTHTHTHMAQPGTHAKTCRHTCRHKHAHTQTHTESELLLLHLIKYEEYNYCASFLYSHIAATIQYKVNR